MFNSNVVYLFYISEYFRTYIDTGYIVVLHGKQLKNCAFENFVYFQQ
jgi:hypothetical protein